MKQRQETGQRSGGLGAQPPAGKLFLKNDMAESNNILTKLQDLLLYLSPEA
jgi:hypothetical protein